MSRARIAVPVALLALGCVPDLKSNGQLDDVFDADGSDYEAPENSWEQCDPPPAGLRSEGFAEGEVFPDLRMMDQHGEETSFWQWYGCVIAVDVSPMWCAPCRQLAKVCRTITFALRLPPYSFFSELGAIIDSMY